MTIFEGWTERKECRYQRICKSMAKALRVEYGDEAAFRICSTSVADTWEETYRNLVLKYKQLNHTLAEASIIQSVSGDGAPKKIIERR